MFSTRYLKRRRHSRDCVLLTGIPYCNLCSNSFLKASTRSSRRGGRRLSRTRERHEITSGHPGSHSGVLTWGGGSWKMPKKDLRKGRGANVGTAWEWHVGLGLGTRWRGQRATWTRRRRETWRARCALMVSDGTSSCGLWRDVRRPIAARRGFRDSQVHLCPGRSLSGAIAGAGSLVAPTGARRRGVEAFRTWSFRSFLPEVEPPQPFTPPAGDTKSATDHTGSFHPNQCRLGNYKHVTNLQSNHFDVAGPDRLAFHSTNYLTENRPWLVGEITKHPGETAQLMQRGHVLRGGAPAGKRGQTANAGPAGEAACSMTPASEPASRHLPSLRGEWRF